MGEASIVEAAVATKVPRLDLLPATVDLSGAEIEMVGMDDRTHRLAQAFDEVPAGRWDICLIDCPPSLGLLTVNALVASRQLLVPLQCEFFALEGLSQLLQTVERIRLAFNPAAFDPRRRADHVRPPQQSVAAGRRRCPRLPWRVGVRNGRAAQRAACRKRRAMGLPALIYDLKCPGSEAYIRLAREMMARLPQPAAEAA